MRTWTMSRNGAITLTAIIAIGIGLVILSGMVNQGLSERTAAGSLLALSFVVFGFGGMLYFGRAISKWQIEEASHLIWERGFVVAAVLATVLGLVLLDDMLHAAGDSIFARLGMAAYFFGAVVVVAAETAYLGKRDWLNPQIVLYVIMAFLAQASFGVSLLQTGLVAGWVGWVTIIWNLGWLLVMLIVRPRDIYYPVLHHVAPLIIGIALLTQR
ncbi:MAG: hypothetical protein HZC41_20675 [Chloroflexi bacterium]|nr:hypothetical protein [Chloroflexota bacterium]